MSKLQLTIFSRRAVRWAGVCACLIAAGCARSPLEPTLLAAPGPGRSFSIFQQDRDACKITAAQVSASVPRQARQGPYDTAFGKCMYARGDQVEGFPDVVLATQPEPRHSARRPNPAMVRDVQGELMRLDYLQIPPDGSLGPKTKSAILQFEREHGMRHSATVSKALLDRLQSTPSNATHP